MIVAWGNNDSESESDEENKVANFCLMAHNDDNANDDDNDDELITHNELQSTFDELYVNFLKTIKELKACKKTSKTNLEHAMNLLKKMKLLW